MLRTPFGVDTTSTNSQFILALTAPFRIEGFLCQARWGTGPVQTLQLFYFFFLKRANIKYPIIPSNVKIIEKSIDVTVCIV